MIINKRIGRTEFEQFLIINQITPADAAAALGVPLRTVYAWCSGARTCKEVFEKEKQLWKELRPGKDWKVV